MVNVPQYFLSEILYFDSKQNDKIPTINEFINKSQSLCEKGRVNFF